MDNINVLIIGYGKIGRIHAKYLKKNGISFSWFDSNLSIDEDIHLRVAKKIEDIDYSKYTHVIIAVNEEYHYSVYKKIREKFSKKILMEKPAIIEENHAYILEDPLLNIGMVERFNPTIETLKVNIDPNKIINIDFARCSAAPHVSRANIFEDIGIHDLDLYFYLLENKNDINKISYDIKQSSKTYFLNMIQDGIYSRFIWSKETYYKERKVIIRQTDCTYIADLQEQSVMKYSSDNLGRSFIQNLYVEKSSPIENEQNTFLNGEYSHSNCTIASHAMMLKIMNDLSS